MEDQKIIALYLARDEQAIAETEVRYGKLCRQIAMHILGNRSDAEECVNDTYLKLWNSIPPEHPRSLTAYIRRMIRNIAIDRYRARSKAFKHMDFDVVLEELAEVTPSDVSEDALREAVQGFLRTLGNTDRRLFLGRYWYATSVKELAKAWDMTPNAVSLRLYKTREKMKAYLSERGYKYE